MSEQLETREKVEVGPAGVYKYWQLELDTASKAEEDYRKEAAELIKRYSGEVKLDFNILWANVETLKPVVYSNTAQPDVRRRFGTSDPVGRQVSLLIERAIAYSCEQYDFDSQIEEIRDETLITGRGVPWVEYKPMLSEVPWQVKTADSEGNEVTAEEMEGAIIDQKLAMKYINYEDFRMSPATCWDDVRWVARRHTPTRDELIAQFGENGKKVKLNASLVDSEAVKEAKEIEHLFKRAEVWEIWDKQKRQRIWIATGLKEPLEVEDDPYGLEKFFPCPKPLYAFKTPGSMRPRAEYEIYRKQVETLNETSRRITALTKELKVKGLYNAVQKAAVDLLRTASDGDFIPVTTPDINASVENMVAYWPIERIAQVLNHLYKARESQLNTIYQLTGLSDIVRGASDAGETATAQQLKGNFASMRMEPRQKPIQCMIRDIFRIKAEIIAEHFSPDILQQMTQIEVTPEMLAVLRSDKLRGYKIDIQTDSTVQPDADADKQRRIEFMTAFSEAVAKLAPMVQAGFLDLDTAKAMLTFVTRGFKVGRELEEAIEAMGQGMAQQPQQQPDPAAETEKAKLGLEQLKIQQHGAIEEKKLAAHVELEREKMQQQGQLELVKTQTAHQSKREIAEISARPATNVNLDAQGALDGVAQTLAGIAEMQVQQSAQMAQLQQKMVESFVASIQQMSAINTEQAQQTAGAMQAVAQAIAGLQQEMNRPKTKTINAPRGADGRVDFSRVKVTETVN